MRVVRRECFGALALGDGDNDIWVMNREILSLVQLCKDMLFDRNAINRAVTLEWGEDAPDVLSTVDTLEQVGILTAEAARLLEDDSHVIAGALSAPLQVYLFLTQACNLRCRHCFNNSGVEEDLPLPFEEIRDLLTELGRVGVTRLALTGGEPLLRPDFFDILTLAAKLGFRVNITSNGTLIDDAIAQRLAEVESAFRFFLVSIEGPEEVHDAICGRGTFRRAVYGLRTLRKAGIDAGFTTTLNAVNLRRVKTLFDLARTLDLPRFSLSIIKPAGRAAQNLELCEFSPLELEDALADVKCLEAETGINVYMKELDSTSREAELVKILGATKCAAGVFTASILANGDVTACPYLSQIRTDLKIPLYNIRERAFLDIWRNAPEFQYVRSSRIDSRCAQCKRYEADCFAGCPGTAYLVTGNPFAPSPFCRTHGLGAKTLAEAVREQARIGMPGRVAGGRRNEC